MSIDVDRAVDRMREDLRDAVLRIERSHADHVELVTATIVENTRQVGILRDEQRKGFSLLNGRVRKLEEWRIRRDATSDERRRARVELEGRVVSRKQFLIGVGGLLFSIAVVIFDRVTHVL